MTRRSTTTEKVDDMPYRKVVTEDVLEHLDSLLEEQHILVEEVRSVRQSNRLLRAIVGGLAILVAVGALAVTLSIIGIISVHHTIEQQDIDRIAGCQVRNSNTDQLVDNQLAESLDNVDNLKAVVLPTSEDPARTEAFAVEWKRRITESHNERNKEIEFVDCDLDGIHGVDLNGVIDTDDFMSDRDPVLPPPGPS